MSGNWDAALSEHHANNGFAEGPDNDNPWGPEQGVYNQAYCASASCMVAYHNGVRFPPGSQFGAKGWAYCPYIVSDGQTIGITEFDHADQGNPASMTPGDFALLDWAGDGVADHVETIIATYGDGTYDTAGYNTGSPEGCHVPIRRDRTYLLAVVHVRSTFYDNGGAAPPPLEEQEDDMPLHLVVGDRKPEWWLTDWVTKRYVNTPDEAAQVIVSTIATGGRIEKTDQNGPVVYAQDTVDAVPTVN